MPLAMFDAKYIPPNYKGFDPYLPWSNEPSELQLRLNTIFAKFRGANEYVDCGYAANNML